jgi:hypothetical protein
MTRAAVLFFTALLSLTGCDDKESADADGDGYLSDDCDNNDAAINPSADEVCDGVDNNCDGQTDESTAVDAGIWYPDIDGDGFGDEDVPLTACEPPGSYIAVGGDCNDGRADISPDAEEVCDGLDNNCDGEADGDDVVGAEVWYPDADGDGYGDMDSGEIACSQPTGWLSDGGDCDDFDAQINPDAAETCDGTDEDCDGTIDEDTALDASLWYEDADGDGVGNDDVAITACDQPSGYVLTGGDCDDIDPKDTSCTCETLTIAVLPGWGSTYNHASLAWPDVETNQSSYGDCVVSFVDVPGNFTYADLVLTGAGVLLVGNVGGGSFTYTSTELDAISDFLSKGHGGLMLTYAVSYSTNTNDDLVEWVGIDPAAMSSSSVTSVNTTMSVLDVAHPLATGLGSKSVSTGGFGHAQALTTSWNKSLLYGADVVMENSAQDAVVVAYDDAWRGVWFTWMIEYSTTTIDGEQMLYNGLIWAAGYEP